MNAVQQDPSAERCLPQPELPYPLGHRGAGTVRWSCLLRCGWHHDEFPGLEPVGPNPTGEIRPGPEDRAGAQVLSVQDRYHPQTGRLGMTWCA